MVCSRLEGVDLLLLTVSDEELFHGVDLELGEGQQVGQAGLGVLAGHVRHWHTSGKKLWVALACYQKFHSVILYYFKGTD